MESHGSVAAGIQCPYHAWTFNLDGSLRAAPNMADVQGFDKRINVGPFDFVGAYDSFTYSATSSFFVNGVGVNAGNRVFFRVWTELNVDTKSIAYAQVDFGSGDLGIDGRAAASRPTRELGPVGVEAAALPSPHGVGRDDEQRLPPAGPGSRQPDPE